MLVYFKMKLLEYKVWLVFLEKFNSTLYWKVKLEEDGNYIVAFIQDMWIHIV